MSKPGGNTTQGLDLYFQGSTQDWAFADRTFVAQATRGAVAHGGGRGESKAMKEMHASAGITLTLAASPWLARHTIDGLVCLLQQLALCEAVMDAFEELERCAGRVVRAPTDAAAGIPAPPPPRWFALPPVVCLSPLESPDSNERRLSSQTSTTRGS